MLHPGPVFLFCALGLFGLSILAMATGYEVLLIADGILLGVLFVDAVFVFFLRHALEAEVDYPRIWSVGRRESLDIELRNRASHSLRLRIGLDLPPEIDAEIDQAELLAPGRSRQEWRVRLRAQRRGRFTLGGLHYAQRSPIGCWVLHRHLRREDVVDVYPDLRQIRDFELLARTDRLSQIGIRVGKRIGGETEFERLRDWERGDALSAVDWKATARRNELTARAYRVAQSQTVMILLDAGRMMLGGRRLADGSEQSHMDQAINAALMLAHVARRQGDHVGLIAYNRRVCRFIKPDGGANHNQRLIHALHDLDPEPCESRHDLAYMTLSHRCRKRSLVIHITTIMDASNATQLHRHLQVVHRRHLPLAVLLRDIDCHAAIDDEDPYLAAAAANILTWRREAIDRLGRQGILTIDCFAEDLSARLVSRYLAVKAANQL